MGHAHDVVEELRLPSQQLRTAIPDVIGAYVSMQRAVMVDGALDVKTKELIALAISVTKECDGCIGAHARGAARRGATEAEVCEAIGVAILLNGGPGTVWGPRALAAFHEFAPTP